MFQDSDFNGNISSWDVSNVVGMSGMFSGTSLFVQNLGNWHIVLDRTAIDDTAAGIVGRISAQNSYLDSQVSEYGIGSGGNSDYFEIVDGDVLRMKDIADVSETPPYTVNITSAGGYGTDNFRVFDITMS